MTESTATASATVPGTGATGYTPGAFVWHELGTTDVVAAEKFYSALLGWTFQSMPMGDTKYWMVNAGETTVGGMYAVDPAQGTPAYWTGTVSVNDVDAAAKTAEQAGGKVLAGPADVPEMVRYAVIADPQGGVFGVCRSFTGDPPNAMPKVGEFCWDQLNTPDPAASAGFYGKVIGWTLEGDPASGFQTFKLELQEASVVQTPADVPAHWLSHIVVPSLADALAKVLSLGGKVLMERIDVPGMGAFGVAQDPQGAAFSLFEGAAS